jgi:hypothetical protein
MDAGSSSRRTTPRRVVAATALALAVGGLAGCGSAASDEGVGIGDLQDLEDQVAELSDRVGQLEDGLARGGNGPQEEPFSADGSGEINDFERRFLDDPEAMIGETVTVSAVVSDVVPTTDEGVAFALGGDPGDEIDVVAPGASLELGVEDVVEVTGEVVVVDSGTFEEDFGVDAEELFEDPPTFFDVREEQVALAASDVQVLDEEPANEFPTD